MSDEDDDPLDDALGDEDGEDPVDSFVEDVTERPDDDEDPFERLDAGPGRQGDPFERLDGEGETRGPPPSHGGEGADVGHDPHTPEDMGPSEDAAAESGTAEAGASDAGGTDAGPDDPFADLEGGEGDPFEGGASVFERVDVGDVDPDGVWDRMDADDEDEAAVSEVPGRRYVEVSKHRFCEGCEYFSPPPEVSCGHEGTEILEFTDMETVRLVDCPIVAERQALEDEG